MRSRVIPGSFVTIERRVPVTRLKSVDLPTLGRPTMTMDGSWSVINEILKAPGARSLGKTVHLGGCGNPGLPPRQRFLQFQAASKQGGQFGGCRLRFNFF